MQIVRARQWHFFSNCKSGWVGLLIALVSIPSVFGLGQPGYVETTSHPDSFPLAHRRAVATILVDSNDFSGVYRAAVDLQTDLNRVTGIEPMITRDGNISTNNLLIIGTVGHSEMIDRLVREKKIDVSSLAGKWESFLIQVVPHPLPSVAQGLVIAGSDKRGSIYGIYDLSEQIGVSPWYWWADVPVRHQEELFVKPGLQLQGPPAVKYRGIFLNDEAPCLSGWAKEKFGGMNHGVYTNVFELLLRLKANYLWPAMWDNSFATDDPLNARLADEYGIVMGTSHHEPMMRAWKEWERAGHKKGSWDYSKNADVLRTFWEGGIQRTKDYEKVITIGMRGDGDEPMSETDSISLLEKIVADQRQIISRVMNTNAEAVPQVWALYKEVQGYYEKGMRVPEDVTLLWCDDNWGNVRRLPTPEERHRAGGAGIYYHFDYVGGPRNYKWLNTVPITKTAEQMNLALNYGADRLWIVNVGDLKPLEFPIEFFLTLAWNPSRWPADKLQEYTRLWAAREFGHTYAEDIADVISKYTKYNGRRKPELLEPDTFSVENYDEADRVLADWKSVTKKAENVYAKLPRDARDAFYQLVLYPTKASAVMSELYIAAGKNQFYANHGDGRANNFATQARELFQEDADLADYYNHKLAGGKWNHMMDQTHIGYTYWQQPPSNAMPQVVEITNSIAAKDPLAQSEQWKPSKPAFALPKSWGGLVESDGYVSIEAEHFSRKHDAANSHWELLPNFGRTLSGMTIFPVTAASVTPPHDSPFLEYNIWFTNTGPIELETIVAPSLNFVPGRGLRLAISFDDDSPQIVTIVPQGYTAGDGVHDWEESVRDGVRKLKTPHTVSTQGTHTLKIWMVDAGVVLEKLIIDAGGLKPSYLGPPESVRIIN